MAKVRPSLGPRSNALAIFADVNGQGELRACLERPATMPSPIGSLRPANTVRIHRGRVRPPPLAATSGYPWSGRQDDRHARCVHFFALIGTFATVPSSVGGTLGYHGEIHVIGKAYFVRQAAILFRFAKATKDPKISAALLEKAADLKLRVEEPVPSDVTSQSPDIEPPAAT